MKRESSQTRLPVAVQEICYAIWKALLQAQLIICWSKHTCLRGLGPLLDLRCCPCLGMLERMPFLGLTMALLSPSAQSLKFPSPSSSPMFRKQSTGGFIKMWPEILETPSSGGSIELLSSGNWQKYERAELKVSWLHMFLHKTHVIQTYPHLQFPLGQQFSTRTDFYPISLDIWHNVCRHYDLMTLWVGITGRGWRGASSGYNQGCC